MFLAGPKGAGPRNCIQSTLEPRTLGFGNDFSRGQLRKGGAPVNASCNASFTPFDAATGCAQVGGTVTSATLQVATWLFTIPLDWASVGGGGYNTASGTYATVPGGANSMALGTYSFAAGFRANGGFAFVTATTDFTPTIAPSAFITTLTGAYLSVSCVWTNANGSSKPSNVIVVVAKSGADFNTIGAALTSITDNSATNRYLVYVAPGTYTKTVTMKRYVDIEGAGELMAKNAQVSGTETVAGASNAELRVLTAENTGGSCSVAIHNQYASPRLTHITALASGIGCSYAIDNDNASPSLTDVTAIARGAAVIASGSQGWT